jgi:hypothetical protein
MNGIIVGADTSPFLDVEFSKGVLFIDDGAHLAAAPIGRPSGLG